MNPTHRLKKTGDLVFPEGYDPADLEKLAAGFWQSDSAIVEQARAHRWSVLKLKSDKALARGVSVRGIGRVDSDEAARAAIDWHFTSSLAEPETFEVDWTLADNSRVRVDAKGMRKIKLAVDEHVRSVRAKRDDFRKRLKASKTVLGVRRVKETI